MKRLPLLVAITLVCLGLSHSECPQGWFGSSCQYKCHCTLNKCEPLAGNCLDGAQCVSGWFGPACQYVDLAQNHEIFERNSAVRYVTDKDDTTCITSEKLVLKFRVPLHLSWFRVHVKEPYYLNKLKIQLQLRNNSSLHACEKYRTALVSETAQDIHCDLDNFVKRVILTGETLQSICSIYISGGRNVALKQKTAQTQSRYFHMGSQAFNAVDGDTTGSQVKGTCAHTVYRNEEPTWNVTLSHPAAVNRYVIYRWNDGYYDLWDETLQSLILRSYDPAGAEVFRFTGTPRNRLDFYTVTSVATQIQTVSISAFRKKTDDDKPDPITLCEVEVYGDSACKPGLYGRECEHKCNCSDTKATCFVSTGGCPSGCPPGYQGEDCSQGSTASPASSSPSTRC
ncbi:hypothetical protein BsWGS_24422 [Bradybaena similaris]